MPSHWLSREAGMKIRGIIGTVRDVIIFESSGKEEGHINVLVELDLNNLLLREQN